MSHSFIVPTSLRLPRATLTKPGIVDRLLPEAKNFGSRGLLLHSRFLASSGKLERVLAQGPDMDVLVRQHQGGEPTLRQVEELLAEAREHGCDFVAVVGGGSVLDLGKAVAGLYHAARPVREYHDGLAIESAGLPVLAAPCTAGTGSEATKVSVLIDDHDEAPDSGRYAIKKSIRADSMQPVVVLLDAELVAAGPRHVIAHSGLDALTQAIEAYTSTGATWFTDQLALKGVELVGRNLPLAHRSAGVDEAQGLLLGSYLTGLAFSHSRLGVVHGLAHPLGARYRQPHGLVCGVCLPLALAFNYRAVPEKYENMSRAVGQDLLSYVKELMEEMEVRNPFAGKEILDEEGMVAEILASGSTAHNPRAVSAEDARALLADLFAN